MDKDSTRPRLSVIVPAFNASRTISQALKSLQTQTMPDWECVVVDDGSTDNTYGIARAFGERDPRIWAIRLERNGGAPRAFNAGLDRARGKYVAQLAADDYWLEDFLEKCVAVLERDQMCPAVYTDFIEWQQDAGLKFVRRMPNFDRRRLLREGYVNYSAFVMRRVMRLDPRWDPVADWKAVIETARHRPLVRLPEILAVRRVHDEQVSQRHRTKMVWKSFLLAFGYAPGPALRRLYQGISWPVMGHLSFKYR